MSKDNRSNDSSGLGCVVMLFVAVVAMPLLGVYLISSAEEDGQRVLGVALLIVGIIVWIKMGMAGYCKEDEADGACYVLD